MKPPLLYFGGKMTMADTIVRLLPQHEHYVEPYAGSLAVLLAKPPSRMETVNDLDRNLVTFWRVLRERPDEFIRACALTPHSRVEYDEAQRLDAADDFDLARQVWVKLTQGRSGRLRRTGWRHYIAPRGASAPIPEYLAGYVARMAPVVERLHRVSLECRPALEILDRYGGYDDVLFYVDPPYLGSTRSYDKAYWCEMRSDAEHEELAESLRSVQAGVVLSGYPSPLYDRLYRGWDRVEFSTHTGQGNVWSPRTEVLWSNRSISEPHLFSGRL